MKNRTVLLVIGMVAIGLCQPAFALKPTCKSCKTAVMPYDARTELGEAEFVAASAKWVDEWRGKRPNKAVDISQKVRESPACFEINGGGDHRKVFWINMMGEGQFIGGYSYNSNPSQDRARKAFNADLNQHCGWIRDMPQVVAPVPE